MSHMLYRQFLFLVSLMSLLLVAGCAAPGPTTGDAVVYIYRDDGPAPRPAQIFVNDVHVFDLDRLGYSHISLPAGRYTLGQKWQGDTISRPMQVDIQLKPGEQRYFSFQSGVCARDNTKLCIRYEFEEQSETAGRAAIASMKFHDHRGAAKQAPMLAR
jgi:hypothetical protein